MGISPLCSTQTWLLTLYHALHDPSGSRCYKITIIENATKLISRAEIIEMIWLGRFKVSGLNQDSGFVPQQSLTSCDSM